MLSNNDKAEGWSRRRGAISSRGVAYIEKWSIPEPNTGCWLWLGGFGRDGYGNINGKIYGEWLSHRYALAVTGVEIEGLYVLHKCDNPACVNPSHLYAGTQLENMQDAVRRGRVSRRCGVLADSAKLTEKDVIEIRERYKWRSNQDNIFSISKDYGVSRATINRVVLRKTWAHVKNVE